MRAEVGAGVKFFFLLTPSNNAVLSDKAYSLSGMAMADTPTYLFPGIRIRHGIPHCFSGICQHTRAVPPWLLWQYAAARRAGVFGIECSQDGGETCQWSFGDQNLRFLLFWYRSEMVTGRMGDSSTGQRARHGGRSVGGIWTPEESALPDKHLVSSAYILPAPHLNRSDMYADQQRQRQSFSGPKLYTPGLTCHRCFSVIWAIYPGSRSELLWINVLRLAWKYSLFRTWFSYGRKYISIKGVCNSEKSSSKSCICRKESGLSSDLFFTVVAGVSAMVHPAGRGARCLSAVPYLIQGRALHGTSDKEHRKN